ncbi:MAG: hypothetical protein ACRDTE_10645 [Pseudonocardiaceae bacterium]
MLGRRTVADRGELCWAPGALGRVLRHAVIGLGWLTARLVRYCLAYPEYAGVVGEARERDRPRRARLAIVAWPRWATSPPGALHSPNSSGEVSVRCPTAPELGSRR